MALPSQTSRAETWRSSSSTGSSPLAGVSSLIRRNRPVVFGALAVGAAIGGWFYFSRGGTPAQVAAEPPPAGDTFLPAGSTAPQAAATAAPAPAAPKPASISMGMLNEPAPTSTGTTTAKPAAGTTLDDLIAQSAAKPAQPVAGGGGGQPAGTPPPAATGTQAPAATTDPLTPPAAPSGGNVGGEEAGAVEQANRLVQQNQPLAARKALNDALMNPALTPEGRGIVRAQLATLNETLFFSPTAFKGDPITDEHAVASGESLARIVRKEGLPIDWRLLMRINKMPSENALRIGQKLKVVRQPLHAVVHKNSYRMDIYAGPPATPGATAGPDGQDPSWTYIRSFRVGLGESNGTPEGAFVVRANSKLVNPKWVNPRTGEVFQPDDPKNPIGERWIGLEGVDDNTRRFAGYGIHGTIDADSIGQQKSMGCVRMAPADVEIVYEMLVDRVSTVRIVQ